MDVLMPSIAAPLDVGDDGIRGRSWVTAHVHPGEVPPPTLESCVQRVSGGPGRHPRARSAVVGQAAGGSSTTSDRASTGQHLFGLAAR